MIMEIQQSKPTSHLYKSSIYFYRKPPNYLKGCSRRVLGFELVQLQIRRKIEDDLGILNSF